MLKVNDVSISYDNKINILSNINFELIPGQITGLIGENGSGKTTLIKMLVGLYKPTLGTITLHNEPIYDNVKSKQKIGFISDFPMYSINDTLSDLKNIYSSLYPNFSESKFNELSQLFKIEANKKLGSMSKGQKMRTNIILALSCECEIYFLDEATSGLDVIAKKQLKNLILKLAEEGKTVLISSHHLNDIETICTNIIFIKNDKIIFNDSLENIKERNFKIQVVFESAATAIDNYNTDQCVGLVNIGSVNYYIASGNFEEFKTYFLSNGALSVEKIDAKLEEVFIESINGGVDNV